ncbi:MAG: glycogen synthase GlgA [Acidobacteriota bacterium]
MRILYAASEAVPFAKTGGLADVIGALPKYIHQLGHRCVVLLPRYRGIRSRRVVLPSLTIPMGDSLGFCSIHEAESDSGVRVFLVDQPGYYDRDSLYRHDNVDYADNAERFAFFSLAAVEFAKRAPHAPDVLHCHDWQTALVPVYLKTLYRDDPFFQRTRTLLTIHNLAYQGVFPRTMMRRAALPDSLFDPERLEFYGNVNFLKGGLLFADRLSTVSHRYSQEIRTPEFGCGLEGVLLKRAHDLTGILNGVDYSAWDPSKDPWLAERYASDNLEGKKACKLDLMAEFEIESDPDRPLIGIISRLTDQKGFDLLLEVGEIILQDGVSMVILGTGDEKYSRFFLELQRKYPKFMGVKIAYDEALAHKIEAGSDMFLMPSRFEPCGLNQIYSLKYGTVPIVRGTGGLDDTITDYQALSGNGFKFSHYTSSELLRTVRRALEVYRNPERWQALIRRAMEMDFSWQRSARRYHELYESLILNV